MQVADRWHLMENARMVFLEAVRRSMPFIQRALASSEIDPALLTCAERIQHDGFLRRRESNKIIKDLSDAGVSLSYAASFPPLQVDPCTTLAQRHHKQYVSDRSSARPNELRSAS